MGIPFAGRADLLVLICLWLSNICTKTSMNTNLNVGLSIATRKKQIPKGDNRADSATIWVSVGEREEVICSRPYYFIFVWERVWSSVVCRRRTHNNRVERERGKFLRSQPLRILASGPWKIKKTVAQFGATTLKQALIFRFKNGLMQKTFILFHTKKPCFPVGIH